MKISKHLVGGEWFTIHWSTKHMVGAGTMHQRRWLGEWVGSDWGEEVQIFWSFQKVWLARPILNFVGVRLINPMLPMFWSQKITPGRCEHLGGRYSGLQTLTTQRREFHKPALDKSLRKFFNDTLSTAGSCANFAQFCPVNCGLGGGDSSLILVVMVSQQLCKMI